MEIHSAANIFPMLIGEEYQELKRSIASGYEPTLPIITYQGAILDGRNRYAVCLELGVEPIYQEYTGNDPYLYVIKANFWRRHLSKEQRIEVMKDMRARGYTYDDIAQATGVSVNTAWRHTNDVELFEIEKVAGDDGKYYPPSYTKHDYPDPLILAQESADAGDGLTADEWEQMPDEYLGECHKQCYGPRWMVKGSVYEYGAYGVYVCSGCGYAYPPRCEPEKVTELERHYEEEDEEIGIDNPALYSSESEEWYTPPHIIERAVKLLGVIDLDPCSNQGAPRVPASQHYTIEHDGLSQQWSGRVYMNPPYGREITKWVDKLCREYESGLVVEAVALVPSRTDTAWFLRMRDYPKCFVTGRLNFSDNDTGAPFPSVVIYLGTDKRKFIDTFTDIGDVYERCT